MTSINNFIQIKSSPFYSNQVDWEIKTHTRSDVQRLIKYKKKKNFEGKLAENIAIPKKLWQALKSL